MKKSTSAWFNVYILLPNLATIFVILIKISMAPTLICIETFCASYFALSLGLLSLFIIQSINKAEIVLPNDDKVNEKTNFLIIFYMSSIVFFILFGLIESFSFGVFKLNLLQLALPLNIFQIFTYITLPIMVIISIKAKNTFNLKASI